MVKILNRKFLFRNMGKTAPEKQKKSVLASIFSFFSERLVVRIITLIVSVVLVGNIILLSYVVGNMRAVKLDEEIRVTESLANEKARRIEISISQAIQMGSVVIDTKRLPRYNISASVFTLIIVGMSDSK